MKSTQIENSGSVVAFVFWKFFGKKYNMMIRIAVTIMIMTMTEHDRGNDSDNDDLDDTHTGVLLLRQFDHASPDFPELGSCPLTLISLLHGALSSEQLMEEPCLNQRNGGAGWLQFVPF